MKVHSMNLDDSPRSWRKVKLNTKLDMKSTESITDSGLETKCGSTSTKTKLKGKERS